MTYPGQYINRSSIGPCDTPKEYADAIFRLIDTPPTASSDPMGALKHKKLTDLTAGEVNRMGGFFESNAEEESEGGSIYVDENDDENFWEELNALVSENPPTFFDEYEYGDNIEDEIDALLKEK